MGIERREEREETEKAKSGTVCKVLNLHGFEAMFFIKDREGLL